MRALTDRLLALIPLTPQPTGDLLERLRQGEELMVRLLAGQGDDLEVRRACYAWLTHATMDQQEKGKG